MTEEEVDILYDEIDADHSGEIEREELSTWLSKELHGTAIAY